MSTPTKPLGVAEVRELLVRAVEEKGADYVYVDPRGKIAGHGADCVNWDANGNPACIAGHVFLWAGVEPRPDLAPHAVNYVNLNVGILDDPAVEALDRAQIAQDTGMTWGEALAAFDAAVQSWA